MSDASAQLALVRARLRKPFHPHRSLLQIHAFLRGRPLASIEARVSEHNLPNLYQAVQVWRKVLGEAPVPEELKAWLTVPEERIKRYGPRVPRLRPCRQLPATGT